MVSERSSMEIEPQHVVGRPELVGLQVLYCQDSNMASAEDVPSVAFSPESLGELFLPTEAWRSRNAVVSTPINAIRVEYSIPS